MNAYELEKNYSVEALEKDLRKAYNRKYKTMYEKAVGRIKIIAAIIVIIAIAICTVISMGNKHTFVEVSHATIHVEANDSLWGICDKYCPDEMDIRDFIKIVESKNNLSNSTIYEGDFINVPIFEEVE